MKATPEQIALLKEKQLEHRLPDQLLEEYFFFVRLERNRVVEFKRIMYDPSFGWFWKSGSINSGLEGRGTYFDDPISCYAHAELADWGAGS